MAKEVTHPEGVTFHGRFEYREIARPCRIVYIQQFCDEAGNAARHPGFPEFPAAMQTTVLFATEGEQATRVTVVSEIHGTASAREIEAFRKERSGMTLGWTDSFDKLEEVASVAPDAEAMA